MGDPHLDYEGLGDGLHLEPADEEAGWLDAAVEWRPVDELEALDHALRQCPGIEDAELGVEELAVTDGVTGHHEGIDHVHGGGGRGRDLEQRTGPKLGRLHLADQDCEAKTP